MLCFINGANSLIKLLFLTDCEDLIIKICIINGFVNQPTDVELTKGYFQQDEVITRAYL